MRYPGHAAYVTHARRVTILTLHYTLMVNRDEKIRMQGVETTIYCKLYHGMTRRVFSFDCWNIAMVGLTLIAV